MVWYGQGNSYITWDTDWRLVEDRSARHIDNRTGTNASQRNGGVVGLCTDAEKRDRERYMEIWKKGCSIQKSTRT